MTPASATGTVRSPFDAAFAGCRGLRLVRGQGAFVEDEGGRRYFDATSQYGVTSLGHGHPALVRAVGEQVARLGSCFASYGNPVRDGLLERLAARLAPLDRFFLCNSGTEAVEAALKLARAATGRSGVLALAHGFHGRTFGALSATFRSSHRTLFEPLLPGFRHVLPGDMEALDAALDDGVGLVLVEVVQGEGGVQPVPAEFLRAAQALARERGALFAVDEVQTGVGRTGRFVAAEHAELDPDLLCLAKGLGGGVPLGAVAFRGERIRLETGAHGSTFGGNPLACAAANTVLDTLEAEGLVERAAGLGQEWLAELRSALDGRAEVREVRGLGLMVGIELRSATAPLQRRLQERGFLTLGAGPRVLRLLPPLIAQAEDLSRLTAAIADEVPR
jgi:acetylornithine/LysW-gamma-L-lysine aminotransferase